MFTVKYSPEHNYYISKLWNIFHGEVHNMLHNIVTYNGEVNNIFTEYHKYKTCDNKYHEYKCVYACSYSLKEPVLLVAFSVYLL